MIEYDHKLIEGVQQIDTNYAQRLMGGADQLRHFENIAYDPARDCFWKAVMRDGEVKFAELSVQAFRRTFGGWLYHIGWTSDGSEMTADPAEAFCASRVATFCKLGELIGPPAVG